MVCGGEIALLPKSSKLKSPSFKNDVESIPIVNSRTTEPESNLCANQTQVTHSRLYRQTEMRRIKASLLANGSILVFPERDYLCEDYYQIREYLSDIHQQTLDIIIVIPDGAIEPNSLNNTALISRLNLKNCLIAGSATFYQENVLHWMHEHRQHDSINPNKGQIIACIPWHWNSQINGCNSANIISQQFCRVGAQLWGEEHLTWRSATAFDAVFIILRVLERYHNQTHQPLLNSHSLIELMDQYFKRQQSAKQGVTGIIKFDENGDRLEPPSEIVTVKWNGQQQKWQWSHLRSM